MLFALTVLTGLAVIGACLLLRTEFGRYRADRAPAPALAAEEAARDSWSTLVLDMVAVMSVLAALISWQATVTFGSASALDAQALQDSATYQAASARWRAIVDFDERLTQLEEQHALRAGDLRTDATLKRSQDPASASLLDGESRVEDVQVRVLSSGFQLMQPSLGQAGMQYYLQYDEAKAQQLARDEDTDYRTLGPDHITAVRDRAGAIRDRAQKLVLTGALLALAIFCWTMARLGRRHRRLPAAVAGVVAMLAACVVLFIATLS